MGFKKHVFYCDRGNQSSNITPASIHSRGNMLLLEKKTAEKRYCKRYFLCACPTSATVRGETSETNGYRRTMMSKYHTQLAKLSFDQNSLWSISQLQRIFHLNKKRADDRKRYTATIPRHRAVQQNAPRFLTPIRGADWSTQPRTDFFDTNSLRYIVARLLNSAHTAFCCKIYHADRLCPKLLTAHCFSISDRILTMGATPCSTIHRSGRFYILDSCWAIAVTPLRRHTARTAAKPYHSSHNPRTDTYFCAWRGKARGKRDKRRE